MWTAVCAVTGENMIACVMWQRKRTVDLSTRDNMKKGNFSVPNWIKAIYVFKTEHMVEKTK